VRLAGIVEDGRRQRLIDWARASPVNDDRGNSSTPTRGRGRGPRSPLHTHTCVPDPQPALTSSTSRCLAHAQPGSQSRGGGRHVVRFSLRSEPWKRDQIARTYHPQQAFVPSITADHGRTNLRGADTRSPMPYKHGLRPVLPRYLTVRPLSYPFRTATYGKEPRATRRAGRPSGLITSHRHRRWRPTTLPRDQSNHPGRRFHIIVLPTASCPRC